MDRYVSVLKNIIAVSSLSLFLTLSVSADTAQKDGVYVWNNFSGGLNTKRDEIDLNSQKKKFATVSENIRYENSLSALSKRTKIITYGTADATEAILGIHRQYLASGTKTLIVTHGDEIETGNDNTGAFTNILDLTSPDNRFQWLTWNDIAIGTDGANAPVKYDGTSASATYLGSCLALDAGSGAGPDGTYTYKVTFYTASHEVSLDTASNTIVVSDNDINLSMIPLAPDSFLGEDIVGRKIYRTATGGSTYKLLSNGTIADNTTVTLTDSDADGALGATLTPTATHAPPKGKLILLHRNRLWLANTSGNPSGAFYSEDALPDIFYSTSVFNVRPDDGDEITFIQNWLGLLTVGKTNTIQKIFTDRDDPATGWSISDPFSEIGCSAMYSSTVTPIGIFYLNYDGIYKFNGQYSKLISDRVTPTILDISKANFGDSWGEYHKNKYYLAYTSEETGSSVNNRILIFNIVTDSYTIDVFSSNCFEVFASGTDYDVLYSGGSDVGKVYAHSVAGYEILHNHHDDFTGTWDDARYIPTKWGGEADSPVLEIAWTETLNDIATTINSMSGIIDRPDQHGSYSSQFLEINALSFISAFWNETIPAEGGDVTFQFRSGATTTSCNAATYSAAVSDPTGSDISNTTNFPANNFVQYRINLTTDDITKTPTVYKGNGYVVRITYNKEGQDEESSIPFKWIGGWNDLGSPGYQKILKHVFIFYESASTGTLRVKFEGYKGDTDTFEIDLSKFPNRYVENFAQYGGNSMVDDLFKMTITEDSINPLVIKKVVLYFDVKPLSVRATT